MARSRSTALLRVLAGGLAVMPAFLLCPGGCSSARTMRQDSTRYVQETGRAAATMPVTRPTTAPITTFADALRRASMQDPALTQVAHECLKDHVAREQALSTPLPRVRLGISEQITMDPTDTQFTGGPVLSYDLLEVIFQKEALAGADAAIARSRLQGRVVVRQKALRIAGLILQMQSDQRDAQLRREALALARERLDFAQAAARLGRADMQALTDATLAVQHATSRWQLTREREKLDRALLEEELGSEPMGEQVLASMLELLSASATGLPEHPLQRAWEHRPEVRIAEHELFLSEIRIASVRREAWPRPTASVGLGQFWNTQNDTSSPVVLNVGATMPLLDWGDVSRRVSKSQLDRDIARVRIVALARELRRELREAGLKLQMAEERVRSANDLVARAREDAALVEQLYARARGDLAGVYAARGAAIEAQVAANEAERDRTIAAVAWSSALGDFPEPRLTESIAREAFAAVAAATGDGYRADRRQSR